MKNKLWKELIVAVLLISTIVSFSPVAYGETTSVQPAIDVVKMEMKQAALAYVEPALKGELVSSSALYPLLNSVKKNYEATKKIILASNLSEKEKQAKLKQLEALYEEKIVKGLIPYIDAYNYATKYLEPLLKEINEAEAKYDFLAVEKAYHKLSVQLKSRTSILYRFTGKAPRDLLLEKYKKPADAKRDELVFPVTIIMKATTAQQLYQAGKIEEVKKVLEDIHALAAELSSTNPFHQALLKELERLQAVFFPTLPLTPVVPIPSVTPPATGGGGEGNSGPSKSSISTIKAVTVIGVAGTVNASDAKIYNVELPIGTILANLTAADIIAMPTNAKATTGTATTTDGGATWQVFVTAENGKSTTMYTINVTVTPSVKLTSDSIGSAGNGKITGLIASNKYVVTEGTKIYGVLADGTLSAEQTVKEEAAKLAALLTGTEITGLTNGVYYKVETALKTFAEQFPDPNLAFGIAVMMGKQVNDTFTEDEIDKRLAVLSYSLYLTGRDISSMAGFDIFNKNLKILIMEQNPNLKSLDVSGLTNLQYLNVNNSGLMSLNISGLSNLRTVSINYNNLSSLDVSSLKSLNSLSVSNNNLTSLDVSNLKSLNSLSVNNNNLTSLDVSGLDGLTQLNASPLTGDKIKSTDSLTLLSYHLPETLVAIGSTPGAVPGDKKITGLVETNKYVVKRGSNYFSVLANGSLSVVQTTRTAAESLAQPLAGTEIINLVNGSSYKVEKVQIIP
ncbi:hypothetical protein [Psychrobacillus sp.]|uniref:hypothetical protein n=1 Tax=Psychrobacillus sp. TaxID=1871623 RepID=UPI0028BF3A94|nr:hypothetical protein [Psychrobacillus sp.]